jgi:hypothetical protein
MRWVGHAAHIKEMTNACIFDGKPEEKRICLGDQGVDGCIILEWMSKKCGMRVRIA